MRTIVKLAYAAGALLMVGCSKGEAAMNDELRKDLELAWSSDAITLAGTDRDAAAQVVSAIERNPLPGPRKVAPSQRVAKHRPARRNPAPVRAERAAVAEDVETAPVEIVSAPAAPSPTETVSSLPSPRPRPVDVSDGDGMDDGRGSIGIDRGRVLGGITVVLRGGGVDGDNCERDDRRRGRMGGIHGGIMSGATGGRMGGGSVIAINNRIPIQGTFPGRSRF